MWNNRIVKFYDAEHGDYYAMCEVFYNPDGQPNGYGVIDDLYGDTPEDVKALVELIYIDSLREELTVLDEPDFVEFDIE